MMAMAIELVQINPRPMPRRLRSIPAAYEICFRMGR
jgi:hypothetical protein